MTRQEQIELFRRKYPKYTFHYKCMNCNAEIDVEERLYSSGIMMNKIHACGGDISGNMILVYYKKVE